jgi:hypothetical protein
VPSGNEICGNCLDDDGDGLTDVEDPQCCGNTGALLLTPLLRIRDRGDGKFYFQLGARTDLATPDGLFGDVAVQFSQPSGDVLCARLPASAFRHRKSTFRFDDRNGTITSAKGIRRAMLSELPDGAGTRVRGRGRFVTFESSPQAGPGTVAVGFTGPDGPRCAVGGVVLREPHAGRFRAP